MISAGIVRKAAPLVRNFGSSAVRKSHHDTKGVVGSNIPFGINNRYLLTLGFAIYFGSGVALPFLMVKSMIDRESRG